MRAGDGTLLAEARLLVEEVMQVDPEAAVKLKDGLGGSRLSFRPLGRALPRYRDLS